MLSFSVWFPPPLPLSLSTITHSVDLIYCTSFPFLFIPPIFGLSWINYSCICMDLQTREPSGAFQHTWAFTCDTHSHVFQHIDGSGKTPEGHVEFIKPDSLLSSSLAVETLKQPCIQCFAGSRRFTYTPWRDLESVASQADSQHLHDEGWSMLHPNLDLVSDPVGKQACFCFFRMPSLEGGVQILSLWCVCVWVSLLVFVIATQLQVQVQHTRELLLLWKGLQCCEMYDCVYWTSTDSEDSFFSGVWFSLTWSYHVINEGLCYISMQKKRM